MSLGLRNDGWKRKLVCIIIDQLVWILHPIFLSLQEAYCVTENQIMLESGHIDDEKYSQKPKKLTILSIWQNIATNKNFL